MSLKSEKKKQIKLYMLQHIDKDDKDLVHKTEETFGISRTTVYSYLRQLVSENTIAIVSSRKCKYELISTIYHFQYSTDDKLEEDKIFTQDVSPIIKGLPENVYVIHRYIFTEIMNNAIDHAEATSIETFVFVNPLYTEMYIFDDGIGIFKKIQQFFKEKGETLSLDEAVEALLPGKLTTVGTGRNGEGIFFSSHAADEFVICSSQKFFRHDCFSESTVQIDERLHSTGTSVMFRLANSSSKKLEGIFDMFSDSDRGFFRTQIPIAAMYSNGSPVSRSEARRLCSYIDKFEDITLDFTDVSSIGQAFAHELFVVFKNNNPNTEINVENANEAVSKMISRVKNTK